MAQEIRMPQLGESVVEGTIQTWFVKVGDRVENGTILLEVETDKANTEVPSTEEGYVKALLVAEGETVDVGTPLITLVATEAELASGSAPEPTPSAPSAPEPPAAAAPAPAAPAPPVSQGQSSASSPPAPRAAPVAPPEPSAGAISASAAPTAAGFPAWNRGQGVAAPAPAQATIPMVQAAAPPSAVPRPPRANTAPQGTFGTPPGARYFKPPVVKALPEDTVVKFTKRRGIIAEHMVYSKHVSPHVPCFAEVDMTAVVELRRKNKNRLAEQGVPLTVLSFLLKATTQALREFPGVNAVVGADEIIQRGSVHLGVAVETDEGLLVPVIRNADTLSVSGLARGVKELADKARNKKITVDDLSGGTFTVTNPGRRGNLFGAAVINQPQVGIVRMGEIVRRPVIRVVDGEEVICVRSMMYLALTYDHRIIDGVTGNGFLYRIRELLEAGEFQI